MSYFEFKSFNKEPEHLAAKLPNKRIGPPDVDPTSILHHINFTFPRPSFPRAYHATRVALGGLGPTELEAKSSQTSQVSNIDKNKDRDLSTEQRDFGQITIFAAGTMMLIQGVAAWQLYLENYKAAFINFSSAAAAAVFAVYTWGKCKTFWKKRYAQISNSKFANENIKDPLLKDLREHRLHGLRVFAQKTSYELRVLRRFTFPLKDDGIIHKGSDELLLQHRKFALLGMTGVSGSLTSLVLPLMLNGPTTEPTTSLLVVAFFASNFVAAYGLFNAKECFDLRGVMTKFKSANRINEFQKILGSHKLDQMNNIVSDDFTTEDDDSQN